MTTSSTSSSEHCTPELVIVGPDSIVAALPYIIGFTPHDSLVVMWMRAGCVRLTMRLDLPPIGASPLGWIDAVMEHRGTHDEVIVCIVPSNDEGARTPNGNLRAHDLIDGLLLRLQAQSCPIRDCLLIVGDRWWSFLCAEPECCPPDGTEVDPRVVDEVAARFALAGVARLPSRQSVLAICAPDVVVQATHRPLVRQARRALAARLRSAVEPSGALEAWRDESIGSIRHWLLESWSPTPQDSHEPAQIMVALCDVRVRDTVLWEVAQSRHHDAHRAFDRAAEVLRAAPRGVIAPIGTVTALLAWLIGDGVRATAALDRVSADDPDYSLAELLRGSLAAGLPPSGWLEMMSRLDRDACRHGAAAPPR